MSGIIISIATILATSIMLMHGVIWLFCKAGVLPREWINRPGDQPTVTEKE